MSVFSKILRAGEGKKVRALQALVPDINELEHATQALSDEALAHRTVQFRERLDRGEDVNDLLVEALEEAELGESPRPAARSQWHGAATGLIAAVVAQAVESWQYWLRCRPG